MGYVHNDIKPSNILVSPSGHLALADFGCATLANPNFPEGHGTEGYKAPETLVRGMVYADSRICDVWSMGMVILQYAVNDKHPPVFCEIPETKHFDLFHACLQLTTIRQDAGAYKHMVHLYNRNRPLYNLLDKVGSTVVFTKSRYSY